MRTRLWLRVSIVWQGTCEPMAFVGRWISVTETSTEDRFAYTAVQKYGMEVLCSTLAKTHELLDKIGMRFVKRDVSSMIGLNILVRMILRLRIPYTMYFAYKIFDKFELSILFMLLITCIYLFVLLFDYLYLVILLFNYLFICIC